MTSTTLDTPDREPPRAVCSVSGNPLFAIVAASGIVSGVLSFEPGKEPGSDPTPPGHRYLPLFGADTAFDLVTEVRSRPTFQVEADKVVRTFKVRPKLAAELLHEIVWWFGAMNSSGGIQPGDTVSRAIAGGMSPAAVNDSARAAMARLAETRDTDKDNPDDVSSR